MSPQQVDPDLLALLVCPESRSPLCVAADELLAMVNRLIATGALKDCGGNTLAKPLEGGLVCRDCARLYPIVDGIPVLVADEAIPLEASPATPNRSATQEGPAMP